MELLKGDDDTVPLAQRIRAERQLVGQNRPSRGNGNAIPEPLAGLAIPLGHGCEPDVGKASATNGFC